MKQKNHTENQKLGGASRSPIVTAELSKSESEFSPSADEVARKAYYCYVNEGSQPGQDVQHWLKAEAELIAERNLTLVHGYHNRN